MIEAEKISVEFKSGDRKINAVKEANITIGDGESIGLAGESGSGKTTLGKSLLALVKPKEGKVLWNGKNVFKIKGKDLKNFRRENQIIYQDPFDSIDIRMRIYDVISEGLTVQGFSKQEQREIIYSALKSVGLNPPEAYSNAFPTQLSGGQLQRVAIARSIVLNPKFIVADEPVSMLDVSIRSGILQIFQDMKEKGTSSLIISHDISTLAYVVDKIYIMYLGHVVEYGTTQQIIEKPLHPYTQALISAIPIPEPNHETEIKLVETNEPVPPKGCPLYPRCPFRKNVCLDNEPKMTEVEPGHYVSCHLY
ncbi:peptide ABC transporter ATPase [Candidatus Acidianus copahuensis]|uniref:Peptide ABC transporter ATPase n=1 Tax=Candidatus Acidianus copahuensis TaxID=1160895 RepID=A0A031LN95_9CREN|nr:ABC transporter ATP-binding protein [Candidatus Acidianus copahuensis]EZQ04880.1 peptide ABC transporter ATPase [Candidatus Acidianus copahuensis]